MNIVMDGCTCTLAYGNCSKTANLFSLHTVKKARGKGSAKRAMRIVRKWADRTGRLVYLTVGPFDDRPMDRGQLISFYITMGWRLIDGSSNAMVYRPKGRKCQLQSSS